MRDAARISVVINTLNAAQVIRPCLESACWADEILVVDMRSDDATVAICREFTERILSHPQVGFVEPARNFGIAAARGNWILVLDADERLHPDAAGRLRDLATSGDVDAVWLPRRNIILGRWIRHTGWWPDHQLRFFRRGAVRWNDRIHSYPEVTGRTRRLDPADVRAVIFHESHRTVGEFLAKSRRYIEIEAAQRCAQGEHPRRQALLSVPARIFWRRYISGEGFRDGWRGLLLSILMAWYGFQTMRVLRALCASRNPGGSGAREDA